MWLKSKEGGPPGTPKGGGGYCQKKPSAYFKNNFYITTSGMFWWPPLQCSISVLGINRILFAVDYPPESCNEAVQFITSAPLSDNEKENICHLNAKKLLGL
jgi:2,3-dihydroxybenzoate decarboxylase